MGFIKRMSSSINKWADKKWAELDDVHAPAHFQAPKTKNAPAWEKFFNHVQVRAPQNKKKQ